jgi:hypothetical protein
MPAGPDRVHVRRAAMYAFDRLFVDAYAWSDGAVSIEGQDLGPHTPTGEEYEYFATVEPGDVPLLLAALGGRPGDDPLALLQAQGEAIVRHGETAWLKAHGVPFTFHTW